jgi:uncharacterized membrane protein YeiH
MDSLLVGVGISDRAAPGDDPVADAVTAEALGYDFVSAFDHPVADAVTAEAVGYDPVPTLGHPAGTYPTYETQTLLTWIAARTTRIGIVPRVLGVPFRRPALVAKAAGLGLFAVTGASKALDLRLGPAPAVILGAVTGVGGGTLRDVLLGQIPLVLRRGLYAIPALSAAAITVTAVRAGIYGLPAALGAVLACFLIRVLGVRYDLNAPMAPQPAQPPAGAGERKPRSRSRYRRQPASPAKQPRACAARFCRWRRAAVPKFPSDRPPN